jgi:MFS family permease
MGVGALSTLVPMFNAELAPPGIRGILVALQQLSICFGILVAYWVAYGTNFIGGTKYPGQSTAAWYVAEMVGVWAADGHCQAYSARSATRPRDRPLCRHSFCAVLPPVADAPRLVTDHCCVMWRRC